MKLKCTIYTPLGEMLALMEDEALCELRFVGQKYATLNTDGWLHDPDQPLFSTLRSQLDDYFALQRQTFELPMAPKGTRFQKAIWNLLLSIPSGTTITYGALSRQLGEQQLESIPAAQAVGGAVGCNPIAIIIPCHRVLGANGSLTGYAGGLERKAALLALEKTVGKYNINRDDQGSSQISKTLHCY